VRFGGINLVAVPASRRVSQVVACRVACDTGATEARSLSLRVIAFGYQRREHS